MNPQPPLPFAPGRAIAVIRGGKAAHLDATVQTLVSAGLRCLEITTNTPEWDEAIARTRGSYGPDVHIGVGTVLDVDQVHRAAEAGAAFVLAPNIDPDVGHAALAAGMSWIPGALTPSEVVQAWNAQATAVKVFPADAVGGAKYLAALRAPLDEIPFIPTGGIGSHNAAAYLAAGAAAVGLGASLLGTALEDGSQDGLAARAQAVVKALAL